MHILKLNIISVLAVAGVSAGLIASCTTPSAPKRDIAAVGAPNGTDPSYEELAKIIVPDGSKTNGEKAKRFETIAEVLHAVKAKHPSYFSHHTLAYRSLSLHGSSFENPRAIVFGENGNLILTFNGDPKLKSYGSLEVMEFDVEHGFQFREIIFKKEVRPHESQVEPSEIDYQDNLVQISKPNPAVCMQCHGQQIARPIWQPYYLWPGMYGSDDDMLFRSTFEKKFGKPHSFDGRLSLEGTDVELEGYRRYLKGRAVHPRYGVLPARPVGAAPGAQLEKFYDLEEPITNRPNVTLMLLLSMQRDRILLRDILAKKPTNESVTKLVSALCSRSDSEKAPMLDVFKEDAKSIRTEDMSNMAASFDDGLRDEDFKITNNVSIPFANAMREMGFDLRTYALNLRRLHDYNTGFAFDFPVVRQGLIAELKKRGLPQPACNTY